MEERKRVLIGSPIRQSPEILREFLISLTELQVDDLEVDCFFIDDNLIAESSQLLNTFQSGFGKVFNKKSWLSEDKNSWEKRHKWNSELIWKVAEYKDKIIEYARLEDYDYLFLIDSDIIIHPLTLKQLITAGKDIISEIHWTRWPGSVVKLPNIWFQDQSDLYPREPGEKLTKEIIKKRTMEKLRQLRIRGVYEVGGVMACTLIAKKALAKGVSFAKIGNLTLWGEDRHFCVRAVALGLSLFVDTHYPGLHLYRENDLQCLEKYKLMFKSDELPDCSDFILNVLGDNFSVFITDLNYKSCHFAEKETIVCQGFSFWHTANLMCTVRLLAKELSAMGNRIIYLNPPQLIESYRNHLELSTSVDDGILIINIIIERRSAYNIDPLLALYAGTVRVFIENNLRLKSADLFYYFNSFTLDHAYWLMETIKPQSSFLHILDDSFSFPSIPLEVRERHRSRLIYLKGKFSKIAAVSNYLREQVAGWLKEEVELLPNGVDLDKFSFKENYLVLPDSLKGIKRPIVGFIGNLTDWLDYDLIIRTACALPDVSFVIIGPVEPNSRAKVEDMRSRPNIYRLEPVAYNLLPYYLYNIDILFLPRNNYPYSMASDPLKLYEYLATGKPVVSTAIPRAKELKDLVYIGESVDDIINLIRVLVEKKGHPKQAEQLQSLEQFSWSKRAERLLFLCNLKGRSEEEQ